MNNFPDLGKLFLYMKIQDMIDSWLINANQNSLFTECVNLFAAKRDYRSIITTIYDQARDNESQMRDLMGDEIINAINKYKS